MDFQPILGKATESFLGGDIYYHNNININDWYLNTDVDTLQKLTLLLAYLHSKKENQSKKPEDRIFVQNSDLMESFGVELITIQKALANAEKMGILSRKFVSKDKELVDKEDAHGMTKRRIIINADKVKELIIATHKDEINALGYKARSREKRFISRRPFTMIDDSVKTLLKDIRKTQVLDVQARKNKISKTLLVKQFKQFKNFSLETPEHISASDAIIDAFSFLIHQPPDVVDRYYVAK